MGLVLNFEEYLQPEILYAFSLPVVLTFSILPFLYLVALVMIYESLFTQIDIYYKNKDRPATIKWEIVKYCHLDISKLNEVMDNKIHELKGTETNEEIAHALKGNGEPDTPSNRREQIYWELTAAADRADLKARMKYATDIQDITNGFRFQNDRRLVVGNEPVPPDSQVVITGRKFDQEQSGFPDFGAEAYDNHGNLLAEGELEGQWLNKQGLDLIEKNQKKQASLASELKDKYKEEVLEEYGITEEEANKITMEAIETGYPTPEPPSIDEYLEEQDGNSSS